MDRAPREADSVPVFGARRVEQIMGTAIGFDVRDPEVPYAAIDEAVEYLRDVDMRFSTYKPESEVCRLNRGEITEDECSPDLRHVLELCERVRWTSEGYFDIRAHRSEGGIDPSGLVKGWSLENAARILETAGARNFCINGGGDIVLRGKAAPGIPWRVGIRHPFQADKIATVVSVQDGAIATSGAYERGDHVRNPFTGKPARGLQSVTIIGPSLVFADAYATAAFAMGTPALGWVAGLAGYAGCAITAARDGSEARLTWTPGFERCFADPH